jgi:hypothetical protein
MTANSLGDLQASIVDRSAFTTLAVTDPTLSFNDFDTHTTFDAEFDALPSASEARSQTGNGKQSWLR